MYSLIWRLGFCNKICKYDVASEHTWVMSNELDYSILNKHHLVWLLSNANISKAKTSSKWLSSSRQHSKPKPGSLPRSCSNMPRQNENQERFSQSSGTFKPLSEIQINLYRIHRIFMDFFHRPVFQKTRRFGNWICFRPQVKVGKKTPTQLGPLERVIEINSL
jgi:hypothetical protein